MTTGKKWATATKEALQEVELIPVNAGGGEGREEIVAFIGYTPTKPGSEKGRQLLKDDNITGEYAGTMSYKSFPDKLNYKVRTSEGLVVLNGSGQLDKLMSKVAPGAQVKITYRGKQAISSGKYAGRGAHTFVVAASKLVE